LPARRRLGLPLVTTFYGRDLSDHRDLDYLRLFAEGTAFVCEGPFMAAQLGELGCPAARIRIVRIGVDTLLFPFAPPRREGPLVLVQACRFVEKKGVDLSIRAFAAARSRLGRSELGLVGDGELRRDLEALAARLGVAGAVRFLGMLRPPEYREVVSRAHLCLQPSRVAADRDTEGGAPTVLLEMQAAGVPIVATRHADIPFVVAEPDRLAGEEDVDALAAEVVRLANLDEADWVETAERGRAFVDSRHDARVVTAELETVYREAAAVPQPVGAGARRLGAAVA
jgi:glycosyltransferase involved in cell wall biosynthesis